MRNIRRIALAAILLTAVTVNARPENQQPPHTCSLCQTDCYAHSRLCR
jgi:hypothetical protein